jgi:uncharacterized phage-associated protein
MSAFTFIKSIQLLAYFSNKEGGRLDKLKALKLVWAAERYHLRNFGKTIINDDFFAMQYGPVPSFTKDMVEGGNTLSDKESEYRDQYLKTISGISFKAIQKFDDSVFSENALEAMDRAYHSFKRYNGFQLADITHLYPEWSKFSHLIPKVHSRIDMDYIDFFNDPIENPYEIFKQDADKLEFMKDYYIEQNNLHKAVYSL